MATSVNVATDTLSTHTPLFPHMLYYATMQHNTTQPAQGRLFSERKRVASGETNPHTPIMYVDAISCGVSSCVKARWRPSNMHVL